MIGLVIFGHEGLAQKFRQVACSILGEMERTETVDMEAGVNCDEIEHRLDEAIRHAEAGHGVLVMADLFGGSPANFSLSRMIPGRVEVVCGLNLAMLLKFADLRSHGLLDLRAMARAVARDGRENVVVAADLLQQKCGPPQATGQTA